MNAIERTGIVDAEHQLRLDEPLPIPGQSRVRVIVLVPEAEEISEAAWAKAASASPAFDFLKDAAGTFTAPPTANRSMTKGKIVLVPFPFDDLTAEKVRPALCLTDPIGSHRHVVVAFISSQMPTSVSATDIVLDSRQKDFAATGLRVPSVLRLHRLVTLTSALIQRE